MHAKRTLIFSKARMSYSNSAFMNKSSFITGKIV